MIKYDGLNVFVQGGGSIGSLSWNISAMLQLGEEEDDATSGLPVLKPEGHVVQKSVSNMVL